jgi:hypothetical protein
MISPSEVAAARESLAAESVWPISFSSLYAGITILIFIRSMGGGPTRQKQCIKTKLFVLKKHGF